MSDGISAMWDDAEDYTYLAKHFKETVRCPGMWPYFMDSKHYQELKERYRKEKHK